MYPGRNIRFQMKKEYTGFDPELKCEILYTGFNVVASAVEGAGLFEENEEAPNRAGSEKISSMRMEISLDPDHRIFRWQEETFLKECVSCPALEIADALEIVVKSGIDIPREAQPAGFHPALPEEIVQCYTLRYMHGRKDAHGDSENDGTAFRGKIPDSFCNPGIILGEEDFIALYIDSDKKRVIGGYRKWSSVPGR